MMLLTQTICVMHPCTNHCCKCRIDVTTWKNFVCTYVRVEELTCPPIRRRVASSCRLISVSRSIKWEFGGSEFGCSRPPCYLTKRLGVAFCFQGMPSRTRSWQPRVWCCGGWKARSNDVAGGLPSTLGHLASPSAEENGVLGVVSGEDDDDDDEELDESLESCVDCSSQSGRLTTGTSAILSPGIDINRLWKGI